MPRPEELDEFDEIELKINGLDVHVFESDVVTGPAFVLVHGFGVSSRYFGPLAKELSQYGRVLVLDLPGFGATEDPEESPRIGGFAHVVNATIRNLKVADPILVGHSMGTQVVVEALVRAPGLAAGAVLAAPVVNAMERRTPLLMWRYIQSVVKEPPSSIVDSLRGVFRSGPEWLWRNFFPMLNYRIEEGITRVQAPLVIVGGRRDRVAPADWCQRLAALRDDSRAVIVEGAAHQMIHTHAVEVARLAVELAGAPLATDEPTQRSSPGLPPCGA